MKIFKPKFWNKKNSLIVYFIPLSIFLQILIFLKKKLQKKNFLFLLFVLVIFIWVALVKHLSFEDC